MVRPVAEEYFSNGLDKEVLSNVGVQAPRAFNLKIFSHSDSTSI